MMRTRFFIFFLFVQVVFVFPQQNDAWYHGKPIRDIVFSGLNNVRLSDLEALTNPYKGRIFDDEIFWEIQGKLYALEYFDYIDPSAVRADPAGNEVIIRFTVIERPVIGRIIFVGNSGLRRSELNEAINIRTRDVVNQRKIDESVRAIRNKYLEKGYPNVVVHATETRPAEDAPIILTFHITENEKVTIRRFEFQGNTRFSDSTLRSQLSLKAKTLFNDGAFNEAKLLVDREAIATYYRNRGYIDAEVKDVTLTFEPDGNNANLTLTFSIEEGIQYTFTGVTFDGNKIFSTEQLDKLIYSRVGEVVNEGRLEIDLQRVSDIYLENGYIFNTIIRTLDKNSDTGELSYTISIVERGRAHIENITIRGNEKTRTDVILREIPLEPGDVFSRTKIMEAMRNLYNLQFFSMIMPETLEGSAENLMELIFSVEEMPTIDLQFGLTFSGSADPDTFPISGLLKWNDRNLAGTGNQLGLELNSSVIDTTSFSLSYLQRWIFGLPLSAGFDFSVNYARRLATMNNSGLPFHGDEPYAFPDGFGSYKEYIDYNRLPPREYLMNYEEWYLSLGISTGYRWLTGAGILSTSSGIRFGLIQNVYDADLYRPFDPLLREKNNDWIPRNSFWFAVSLDQRDIFYDPSRGYYFYQRFSLNGIFDIEREHFIRSDSKAQYYMTLFDFRVTDNWNLKTVLALHSGISFIHKQPGRDISILHNNKLSVDGMFVGRGWNQEYHNKGHMLWDNWVELRFPLVTGILAFDLFFDAAGVDANEGDYNNGNYFQGFSIENLRFSYGGGIRFTIPQFPIRLSLAKRFRIVDNKVVWEPGAIGGDPNNPYKGLDLVVSFALAY